MNTAEVRDVGLFQCKISRKELQGLMEVYSNMGAKNTENMTQASKRRGKSIQNENVYC